MATTTTVVGDSSPHAATTAVDPPRRRQMTRNCADESLEQCEEIPFRGATKIGQLALVEGGLLHIDMAADVLPGDVVVIWFETVRTADASNEYFESSSEVSCRSSVAPRFRVGPLEPDTAYTVCVVSKAETTVSPLDCLPYYNQTTERSEAGGGWSDAGDDDVWILEEDKAKVIGLVVCGAVVSLLFGAAMSFVLVRKHPAWLKGNNSRRGTPQATATIANGSPFLAERTGSRNTAADW